MSEERNKIVALMAISVLKNRTRKKNKRKHNMWMKEWYAKRGKFTHTKLLKELNETSHLDLKNFL